MTPRADLLADPAGFYDLVAGLAQAGAWVPLAAALLVGIIGVAKRFELVNRLPTEWIPAVTVIVGTLGTAAGSVLAGEPWPRALLTGVITGVSAVGLHQSVRKTKQAMGASTSPGGAVPQAPAGDPQTPKE